MTGYSLLSLLACAGAVGASFLFDKTQRSAALTVAGFLLLFWLAEEAAYPPYEQMNPVRILWALGLKTHSESMWPLFDGFTGAVAMAATSPFWFGQKKAWWGPAIWILCLWSVLIHITYKSTGVWSFDQYNDRLQLPFWARLAVFYAIAIKGVVEHVCSILRTIHSSSALGSRFAVWAACPQDADAGKVHAPR